MAKRIQSFEEFWPFYLREHSKHATRMWHFAGSSIGLAVAVYAALSGQPWLLPLALLPGYGFAWYSHFFVEMNKPASFKYPLWSFIADWKMWSLIATRRIGREVERHVRTAA